MSAPSLIKAAEQAGFTHFLAIVRAGDLVETLNGAGPFTVFAPTDEAFERLPDAVKAPLFDGGFGVCRSVISAHFALGAVSSARFAGKRIRAVTFDGESVLIDGREGLRVERASVVIPDIAAANGVIHGIDRVLRPSERLRSAPAARAARV